MAFYGAILGIASTGLLLPWLWSRPHRAPRLLPWMLTVVFALAGVLFWVHASRFSLWLPLGINRRLIKAALWLSLAAVITFYTALAHSFPRRRYGRRSRIGLAIVTLLTLYVVVERREAFRPTVGVTPRPSAVATPVRPNLLVVGVGTASLDVILPLSQQGQLPFFAALLRDGAYARLQTLEPGRSLPAWMSLVTGKLPYKHGVVATRRYPAPFLGNEVFELTPSAIGFSHWGVSGGRLPSPAPVRSMTVWQIFERVGVQAHTIGWPGTPPLPVGGDDPGPIVPTAILPAADAVGSSADLLRGAVQRDHQRLLAAERLIDEATGRAEGTALFLHLGALEQISLATYGAYSAVHFEGRQGAHLTALSDLLVGYYATLDSRLAALWERLPEPRLMLVVSAYGVTELPWWRQTTSVVRRRQRDRGSISGSPDGFFALRGTGVATRFLNRVHVTDVAPTVLYAMGLPSAQDLDGRVLVEAFEQDALERTPLMFVPSYETTMQVGGARE